MKGVRNIGEGKRRRLLLKKPRPSARAPANPNDLAVEADGRPQFATPLRAWRTVEISGGLFSCANATFILSLALIAALEFFDHHLSPPLVGTRMRERLPQSPCVRIGRLRGSPRAERQAFAFPGRPMGCKWLWHHTLLLAQPSAVGRFG